MIQNFFTAILPILPWAAIIILIIAALGSDNKDYYRSAALNGESCHRQ